MNVAIILAAGESRRMGQPKQLLPFGDKTMLECVIDAFRTPRVDEIIVVLGHKAEEIAVKIVSQAGTPVPPKMVKNLRYEQGMFTSVQAGLRALPEQAALIMIALCDQPRLQRETNEKLIGEFEKKQHRILIPMYEGRQGHPLLFRAGYAKEILVLGESLTLKHFLAAHAGDITRLPVADEGVLIDIDDQADYERELRNAVVGHVPSRGAGGLPRRLRRLDSVWAAEGFPCFFLTVCIQGRARVLANDQIHVRLQEFLRTSATRYGWWPSRYVIMPDHLHFLVAQGKAPREGTRPTSLGEWVKALKAVVSRGEFKWQNGFFDHVLRSDESEAQKWEYIRQNPVRAGLVSSADEWPYAGEINYESATESPREGTRPTTE